MMRVVFWEVSANVSDGPSVVVVVRRATAAGGWVGWLVVGWWVGWFGTTARRIMDGHLVMVVVVVGCHPCGGCTDGGNVGGCCCICIYLLLLYLYNTDDDDQPSCVAAATAAAKSVLAKEGRVGRSNRFRFWWILW